MDPNVKRVASNNKRRKWEDSDGTIIGVVYL